MCQQRDEQRRWHREGGTEKVGAGGEGVVGRLLFGEIKCFGAWSHLHSICISPRTSLLEKSFVPTFIPFVYRRGRGSCNTFGALVTLLNSFFHFFLSSLAVRK
jgi:hypothetical protein